MTAGIELDEFERVTELLGKLGQLNSVSAEELGKLSAKLEAKRLAQSQSLKERMKNYF